MKNMIICPECGELVFFNSYFGAYICPKCSWEDNSYGQRRDTYTVTLNNGRYVKTYRHVRTEVAEDTILSK